MDVYCWCGRSAVLRTSWTDANPGRRFWGCSRFMEDRVNSCNFHLWFDPPMCARARTIIPGLLRRIEKLEVDAEKLNPEKKKASKRRSILVFMVVVFVMWSFLVMKKNVESATNVED